MMTDGNIPGSFRDPSGFLFCRNSAIYRQINNSYRENYEHLMDSGLYECLVNKKLLIPHREADIDSPHPDEAYTIIKPDVIPFISYPYEWCFSQLKDSALVTLEIQKRSLQFGMSLKDSSAYNIQFQKNRPILIDTLSFEKYREGQPWIAYRQFCQHFLAPLALMTYCNVRLSRLLQVFIDGIPLDLAGSLLPFRTAMRPSLLSHIHLHARSQKYFADKMVNKNKITGAHKMSRLSLLGLIDNLESTVRRLRWKKRRGEWSEYYEDNSYSPDAFRHKKEITAVFIDEMKPGMVWDLGANVGTFSRIAGDRGIYTVSVDSDPSAVEKNYLECKKRGDTSVLPLWLDLTNPTPGLGWENRERMPLLERGPADMVIALALIHHLAISNNLPFGRIADFFGTMSRSLIIEFVPKSDFQVQRLLSFRSDIFPDYTQESFEREFSRHFIIRDHMAIRDSGRILYLMQRI